MSAGDWVPASLVWEMLVLQVLAACLALSLWVRMRRPRAPEDGRAGSALPWAATAGGVILALVASFLTLSSRFPWTLGRTMETMEEWTPNAPPGHPHARFRTADEYAHAREEESRESRSRLALIAWFVAAAASTIPWALPSARRSWVRPPRSAERLVGLAVIAGVASISLTLLIYRKHVLG